MRDLPTCVRTSSPTSKERNTAMKNIDKYDLQTGLVAYKGEMAERSKHGIEGLPFEDWVEEDADTTAKLIAEKKREAVRKAMVEEAEKEAIRKGMKELKKFYKANGFEEADKLTTEIYRVAPKYDLYMKHTSACNCFHSGMWEVYCGDFNGVWDFYNYIKECGSCGGGFNWKNPAEWMEQMKELAQYIKPFMDEAKPLLEKLKAEGGAK